MVTKSFLITVFSTLLVGAFAQTPTTSVEDPDRSPLRMTDAEQVAFTKSHLDAGNLVGLPLLASNRSSLILPIIEKKIEEVLTSKTPSECFTNKTDPDRFVGQTESLITGAGDEEALKTIRKLLALDAKRFDGWVSHTFAAAWIQPRPRPFGLAYWAFGLGDPALDSRVAAWAEGILAEAGFDSPPRRRWAEALVDRYGGVPTTSEWSSDPIVSRMKPAIAESLRDDVLRFARDAWEKSPRRLLAMSDAEQIAFVQTYFERGFPYTQMDAVNALARGHSSLILPIIGARIQSALQSVKPSDCQAVMITDSYPRVAIMAFVHAGDVEALRQAASLAKVETCGNLASGILKNAEEQGNLGTVLYGGLEIGNPELDRQITAWVEARLAEPSFNVPTDFRRRLVAEIVKRYRAVPTTEQLARDPIVSRLKPRVAGSFRSDIVRMAAETADKRDRQ